MITLNELIDVIRKRSVDGRTHGYCRTAWLGKVDARRKGSARAERYRPQERGHSRYGWLSLG
jgi:hypothetical protein